MKRIIILILLVYVHVLAQAQTVSPMVISSSGWYASAGGYSLSQTFCEMTMVETFSQQGLMLTQGFQQPDKISTGILDFAASGGTLTLFPNPASDHFKLSIDFAQEGDVTVSILDLLGQKVTEDISASHSLGKQLLSVTIGELAGGLYLVSVSLRAANGENYQQTQRLEIIK